MMCLSQFSHMFEFPQPRFRGGRKFFCVALAFAAASSIATAQTPSTALLILEKDDNMLAIADPATLNVVGRAPAGKDPHEIAASADGRFAFISNYGGPQSTLKTISVVDVAAQKALTAVDLGALRGAHGIQFADGKVYFTAEVNKAIGRFDASSRELDWILGIGQNRTHMLAVSKNRERIFTSNVNSNSIAIIERNSGGNDWNETIVSVGKGPEGFDVSPDEKELWAANSHDGTVSIVDTTSKKVIQTLSVPAQQANRLKFTPDGKLALVSDLRTGDLFVLDAAARKQIKKINLGHGVEGILMAPDNSRAYVAVSPDANVAVIDLKKLEVIGRIATGKGPDGMAWAVTK